jgi:hypothetical protein
MDDERITFRIKGGKKQKCDTIDELINCDKYDKIIWLKINNYIFNTNFIFPNQLEEIYIANSKNCYNLGILPNSIRYVDITNSYLSSCEHLFSDKQHNIETVILTFNQIRSFPQNLPNNLISINVSNNSISKLPDNNCFPPNIQFVELSSNSLLDLPEWLLELNPNTTIRLMPNRFWFNAYSEISLNKKIHGYHIQIAERFFGAGLRNKLIKTKDRSINEAYIRPLRRNDIDILNIRDNTNIIANQHRPIMNMNTTAEQSQNVHNSDIQNSFSKSVTNIMQNPAPKISNCFNKIRWHYILDGKNIFANLKLLSIIKLDYSSPSIVSRNGVTYSEILERIWAISEIHEYKNEIRNVLRDEIIAGKDVCFTGKVTRLVNTLSGFVEEVQIGISENEQINNAVIATIRRCEQNKELDVTKEVKAILDELNVPNDRQDIWLNAI